MYLNLKYSCRTLNRSPLFIQLSTWITTVSVNKSNRVKRLQWLKIDFCASLTQYPVWRSPQGADFLCWWFRAPGSLLLVAPFDFPWLRISFVTNRMTFADTLWRFIWWMRMSVPAFNNGGESSVEGCSL